MTATYTPSQYAAQARVLRAQIADEDLRLGRLGSIPEDVRGNHERTINMRRAYFVKRLEDLRQHLPQEAQQ